MYSFEWTRRDSQWNTAGDDGTRRLIEGYAGKLRNYGRTWRDIFIF